MSLTQMAWPTELPGELLLRPQQCNCVQQSSLQSVTIMYIHYMQYLQHAQQHVGAGTGALLCCMHESHEASIILHTVHS